jgi:hypothetical protein
MSELTETLKILSDKRCKRIDYPYIEDLDYAKRKMHLEKLLEGLSTGSKGNKGINIQALTDIRIRDALLRTMYDAFKNDTPQFNAYLDGLLYFAHRADGEARLSALACWSVGHWINGNEIPLEAVLIKEDWSNYSLLQLLDIAKRHNVPSIVMENSIAENKVEKCLQGAA